jgi:hypothetical protein
MNINVPYVSKDFEKLEAYHNIDFSKEKTSITNMEGTFIELEKQSYGYIIREYPPDSYFIIIKQYYQNGNIMEKGVVINSGNSKVGHWYVFDSTGTLINDENSDKGYEFSIQDLIIFLKLNKIDLTIGRIELYTGIHTTIDKLVDSDGSKWIVRWLKEPMLIEEWIIDGNSGKVMRINKKPRIE